MSARRSRELANDLARRAIEAAERRNGGGQDAIAERLREAADADGRLDVEGALEALTGDGERGPWNPFTDPDFVATHDAKQQRLGERLFGPQDPEPEPTGHPEGDADGGRGEADTAEREWVGTEQMRVYDLDELMSNDQKEND